jgi:hypothetical protein
MSTHDLLQELLPSLLHVGIVAATDVEILHLVKPHALRGIPSSTRGKAEERLQFISIL